MKLTAMALAGLMMCGCAVAQKEPPHDYSYAAQLTNYREDLWQDFLYIKKHGGNMPKFPKATDRRFHLINHSIPDSWDYYWEIEEAQHVAFCSFVLSDAIYYYGMKIGEDPTSEAVACRNPHKD